jgi:hypothetical protein
LEFRDCPEPPFVVLVTDSVEVVVGGTVVVDMVNVTVAIEVAATVVVEVVEAAAGPNDAVCGVETRPPETVTIARAKRMPAASPMPKRFPSIMAYPL